MGTKFTVKINFINGESLSIDFSPDKGAEWSQGAELQKLLDSNMMAFEVEGKVMFLPTRDIRSIEVSPATSSLKGDVIKNLMYLTQGVEARV